MKINQEKFYKLKQLDRIEYRQRQELISERYNYGEFITFTFTIFICGLILLLMSMNAYHMGGEEASLNLIKTSILIFKVGIIYFIISIIISIGLYLLKCKKLLELEEEYFKVEVKK